MATRRSAQLPYGVAFGRVLRALQGRRYYFPARTGLGRGRKRGDVGPPQPPAWWQGTRPEWAIWWAHGQLGLQPDRSFYYQYELRTETTDGTRTYRVDFYEADLNMVVQVQGQFFHYILSGSGATDRQTKADLEAGGYPVVFIDEADALTDPVAFLRLARLGIDRSAFSRGGY